jgi:hypothetical protein
MVFRYEDETQWRHCDTGYVQGEWYYRSARSGPYSAAAALLVDLISRRDAALHDGTALLSPVIAQDLYSTSCDCADH